MLFPCPDDMECLYEAGLAAEGQKRIPALYFIQKLYSAVESSYR